MNGHQTRPGDRAAAVAIDPDGIDTIATDRRTQTADPTEPGSAGAACSLRPAALPWPRVGCWCRSGWSRRLRQARSPGGGCKNTPTPAGANGATRKSVTTPRGTRTTSGTRTISEWQFVQYAWADFVVVRDWVELPGKSAEDPERFIDFVKDGRDVLVELSTGEIIGVNNPDFGFPTIRIWIGQITMSEMKIEQTLLDTGMAENQNALCPG